MLSYLDGATAGMFVAAVASGAAGIGVLARMYGNRVLGVVSPARREKANAARRALVGEDDDLGPS